MEGAVEQEGVVSVLTPALHQMWEALVLRGLNEVLSGEMQPEVTSMVGPEARWEGYDQEEAEFWRQNGSKGEGDGAGGLQPALQPGCRAPVHLRKRVERGEKDGGVKRGEQWGTECRAARSG